MSDLVGECQSSLIDCVGRMYKTQCILPGVLEFRNN